MHKETMVMELAMVNQSTILPRRVLKSSLPLRTCAIKHAYKCVCRSYVNVSEIIRELQYQYSHYDFLSFEEYH